MKRGHHPRSVGGFTKTSSMADETMINNEKNDADFSSSAIVFTFRVNTDGDTIVFELNTSPAAKDLYGQLPLNIAVENYSNNEKIFHPPEKLSTAGTPLVDRARAGTLAYYAPWGNVVIFYGSFGSAPGLYELGHVVSGAEYIHKLSGTIRIEKGVTR